MKDFEKIKATYQADQTVGDLDIFFWIFDNDYSFDSLHWHRSIEINYILSGEIDVFVGGKSTTLLPGDVFLIDSNIMHSSLSAHGNVGILIQLPYVLLKKYIPDFDNLSFSLDCHSTDPIHQTKVAQFIEVIHKMEILFKVNPKGSALRFNGLVFELLYELYHNFSSPLSNADISKRQKNYDKLGQIMDYTCAHYAEAITIDEIAAVACFQKEYFCHFFKKNMGMTYLDFLNEIRLSHICQDLLATDAFLKDILEKNGFHNYKAFRKLFYEKFKVTPSEYRRNHSARNPSCT